MPEGIVLIVRNDPTGVEADVGAGVFSCPSCGVGVLARWGFARRRVLRDGQVFRPRRSICKGPGGCGATHVLLADVCLLRRRDSAEVIGVALQSMVEGRERFGEVADRLGVPWETVRGWLLRFRRWAEVIRAHFTRWLLALMPGRPPPEATASKGIDALEAIGAAARAASLRLGIRPVWSWASALSGGALLANTSSTWSTPD
jgi:hypothetical protein